MLRRLAQRLWRSRSTAPADSGLHIENARADCPHCQTWQEAHAALEQRSSRLAVQERRLREATAAARVCAVHWDIESGRIDWESGIAVVMGAAGLTWTQSLVHWSSLLAESDHETLRARLRVACETRDFFEARFDLRAHGGRWEMQIRALPDPEIRGKPRTARGLVALTAASQPRAETSIVLQQTHQTPSKPE